MPLPKPLSEIKNDLQALVANNEIVQAIATLQGLLPSNAEKKGQTILLEGRLSQINRDHHIAGIVKLDDYQLETARIRDAMLQLIKSLEEKDFDPAASHAQPSVSAIPKFAVIYDIADSEHCKMLNKHLNVLKIMKKIQVYNVQEGFGDLVAQAKQEVEKADYLLVLITVNLFNSPEWFELVYEAMGDGRRLIPIRIEQADFEGTGLEKLRSLPTMNRAVSQFKSLDDAYVDIVTELRKLLPK
ncbi:MAG: toll/interleukin-1 receptor domain-containing protein [Saprospiraceae bacterium]|nr:toll/interleukin-1 receptor domain-containing protein [Saprospiraceae bacterium]